jgi:hypothetical protein
LEPPVVDDKKFTHPMLAFSLGDRKRVFIFAYDTKEKEYQNTRQSVLDALSTTYKHYFSVLKILNKHNKKFKNILGETSNFLRLQVWYKTITIKQYSL